MPAIRHRVGMAASPAAVYERLATKAGLAKWWTAEVTGEPEVGGTLIFHFGTPENPDAGVGMEVVSLTSNSHVGWRCVQGPDEWVGTHLNFDLKTEDGETVLLFTHADWREPVEFMYHSSTKWGLFLLGLKIGLEGGPVTAFPNEMKISRWG